MTDVLQALYEFWHGTGFPAYLEGYVPDDAMLPYITYSAAQGAFFEEVEAVATLWTTGGMDECSAFLDEVMKLIPVSGKMITTKSGAIVLFPGTGDFLTADDELDSDGSITGINFGRVAYRIQFYCV